MRSAIWYRVMASGVLSGKIKKLHIILFCLKTQKTFITMYPLNLTSIRREHDEGKERNELNLARFIHHPGNTARRQVQYAFIRIHGGVIPIIDGRCRKHSSFHDLPLKSKSRFWTKQITKNTKIYTQLLILHKKHVCNEQWQHSLFDPSPQWLQRAISRKISERRTYKLVVNPIRRKDAA